MKYWFFIPLLLVGCNRKDSKMPSIGSIGNTPVPTAAAPLSGPQEVVAAGQSNMYHNPLDTTFAPFCLLPTTVTNIAVGGSKLASWDYGANHALLINTLKQKRPNVLLWWQGEADLGDPSYGGRFQDFLAHTRKDSGLPTLIIIYVQLGNSHGRPEWDMTKSQQEAIHELNTYMVRSEDVPQDVDNLHYTPTGYSIMGQRLADAFNNLPEII